MASSPSISLGSGGPIADLGTHFWWKIDRGGDNRLGNAFLVEDRQGADSRLGNAFLVEDRQRGRDPEVGVCDGKGSGSWVILIGIIGGLWGDPQWCLYFATSQHPYGAVPRNLSFPLGPEGGEARIIDNYQCIGGHIA